jgi:hypothetical protein
MRTSIRRQRRRRKEQAKRLGVLMSVVEDQQRGVPHEHVVCPHTTALEIAFTRAFFDVDRYRFVIAKPGRHHAREFHGYPAKTHPLPRQIERLVGPLVAAPAAL